MDIVCVPGVLYDRVPPTNRQQVMNRLAGKHRVMFVEQPKYPWIQAAKYLLNQRNEQQPMQWFQRLLVLEERKANLFLHSLLQYLPVKNRSWRRLNYALNVPRLQRSIEKLGFRDYILWIYTPEAVPLVSMLNPATVCYDCVDEYAQQPYYRDNYAGIVEDEQEILHKSDLVFTSAITLYEEKRKYNKHVHLVPNVAEYDHFAQIQKGDLPVPEEMKAIGHPVIGFTGALDQYKVDFELLAFLADQHPEWNIVLIGKAAEAEQHTDLSLLRSRSNIHLLGSRPYDRLPSYMQQFDVCIIPYTINEYTMYCLPLKFHEYLASGKPVVTTKLPALAPFAELVPMCSNHAEFAMAIEQMLGRDGSFMQEQRIATAKQNTWDGKVQKMEEILTAFVQRPGHIAS